MTQRRRRGERAVDELCPSYVTRVSSCANKYLDGNRGGYRYKHGVTTGVVWGGAV